VKSGTCTLSCETWKTGCTWLWSGSSNL
jgi:hypothetical protein